jgi:integrase/recombinase XerD
MILLSVRAGLRAKEIAMAKWGMVTDADGEVGDAIHLTNILARSHRQQYTPQPRRTRSHLNFARLQLSQLEC